MLQATGKPQAAVSQYLAPQATFQQTWQFVFNYQTLDLISIVMYKNTVFECTHSVIFKSKELNRLALTSEAAIKYQATYYQSHNTLRPAFIIMKQVTIA